MAEESVGGTNRTNAFVFSMSRPDHLTRKLKATSMASDSTMFFTNECWLNKPRQWKTIVTGKFS